MNNPEKSNITTKFDEVIITTSKLDEMKGKFLSERLLRTWNEEFVDEDSGEVVSIERNEIILDKGTFLGQDQISEINFMLQSGDIKEVSVSNQQRECNEIYNHTSVWSVKAEINRKKKAFFLYANSIDLSREIVSDFISQNYSGSFRIVEIKELSYSNLISDESNDDERAEKEEGFYSITVEITSEDRESYNQSYILKSSDADKAKNSIISNIQNKRNKDGDDSHFEVAIISAKTISCEDVIEYDFTEKYYENSQNKTL